MAKTTTQSYTIRFAHESDVPSILAMINELALYEKALDSVQATHQSLLETLTFPSDLTKGFARTLLISPVPPTSSGQDEEEIAGMAIYFPNYSTWRSAPGIYLEDLYVREKYRKRGFGKGLLSALARETEKIGGKRLEWSVLKWNENSIRFYVGDGVGAERMEEWVGMRVEGGGLARLAGGGNGN